MFEKYVENMYECGMQLCKVTGPFPPKADYRFVILIRRYGEIYCGRGQSLNEALSNAIMEFWKKVERTKDARKQTVDALEDFTKSLL